MRGKVSKKLRKQAWLVYIQSMGDFPTKEEHRAAYKIHKRAYKEMMKC